MVRPNQLKWIFKLGNCFWLQLQLVIPPNLIIQWTEVRWTGGHSSLAMKSWQFDLVKLKMVKTVSTTRKIYAIVLNIKINQPKLIDILALSLNENIAKSYTEAPFLTHTFVLWYLWHLIFCIKFYLWYLCLFLYHFPTYDMIWFVFSELSYSCKHVY